MKDDNKTKKQLVHELTELRSQNAELKKSVTVSISAELMVDEALRYAESIVETVREPLLVLDADLKIISANHSFYRTFKVTPGETIGNFVYDLGNKQWDIPRLRELLEEILPEKQALNDFEVANNFQDIGHKIMLLNAREIYQKDIGAKMILLAIEDITERKRLGDLLAESEERYRHVFETANDGIVLFEKREGKITHANQAVEKILGYSLQESVGKKLQDIGIVDIDDFQTIMQILNEIGITYYTDVTIKTKSGQHIDTDIYLADRAKLVQCNIRDVTQRKRMEYELSESEKQYRTLFNAIDEGFCIIEVIFDEKEKPIDYRFLEINPSFEKQTGLIDAQGKRMRELAPKHEEYWFEIYGKIAVTGQPARFVNRAEQLHRWYDVYAFRLGQPEDRQVAILFNDITERKRIEEALREGERFLQDVFDSIKEGISVLDLNLKIVRVNSWMEEMYSKEGKFAGRKCYEVYQKRDTPCPWCPSLKTIETGEIHNAIVPYPSKENPTGWFDLSSFPLRNIEGNIVGVIEYMKDITQQKRSEEALRKSEEHYRSIFEDSRDAVYITTRNGKFIDANQSALDLFGYSREEMASVNALQLYVHPGDARRFQKETEKKGFLRDYEVTFRKKDGTEIDCLVNTTLRRANDGSILGYQGVIRDMTEQKKLEAQLRQAQKMESIGTMAGGIAHDFNNILGAIIGYTEIADLQVPEDNKAKESLKEVLKAGRRARDLVKQILAFSRKGEQERIPIQISPIVKEALKLLRSSLPTTIEIRQDIKSDTGIVEADPTQIHQIMMNLCTNASHAMRENGGILEVGIRNVEVGSWDSESGYLDMTPGNYLRLTISDTGQGMTPEVLDRIFEPYYTTKEKGEGTGLGLSVVHGIVKNYGGTITAYSEPGKGSTFHVYLPVIQEKAEVPGIDEVVPIPTGNEHILFIDDEPALVEIDKQMLERLGYEVTTRTSSMEALELFRTKPDQFDLVITDMTMPHMTGERLANELMNIRSDIPVIICTGYSELISEEKAKEMGIRAFVMKPLVIRDLAKTVRGVLEGQELNI
jgi:PAS domain S-box-containing protein